MPPCHELAVPVTLPQASRISEDGRASCFLCGSSEPHDHPADEYGTFYPDPDYPRGPL